MILPVLLALLAPAPAARRTPPPRPAAAPRRRPTPATTPATPAARALERAVAAAMNADSDGVLDAAEALLPAAGSADLAAMQPLVMRDFRAARDGRRRAIAWLERVRAAPRAPAEARLLAAYNLASIAPDEERWRLYPALYRAPRRWAVSPVTGDYAVTAYRESALPSCAADGVDTCAGQPGWRAMDTGGGPVGHYQPDFKHAGVCWAVSELTLDAPAVVALNGGTSQLFADGRPAAELSNLDRYTGNVTIARLPAGRHLLAVKFLVEESGVNFSLVTAPDSPSAAPATPLAAGLLAEALGDDDGAAEAYAARLETLGPDARGPEARAIRWRLAGLYRANRLQLFPDALAEERERALLESVGAEAPAVRVHLRLAEDAESHQSHPEAQRLYEAAIALAPRALEPALDYADYLERRGFSSEAWARRRDAEPLASGREGPLTRLLAGARDRGEVARVAVLAPALAELAPDSDVLQAMARERDPGAFFARESARFAGWADPQHGVAVYLSRLADEAGDPERALSLLDAAFAPGPVAGGSRLLRARLLARLGREDEARALLREMASESADAEEARDALAALGESEPVLQWRLGPSEIARATARPPGAAELPSEYLLDWSADYYYPDFTRRSLYHSLTRVLSTAGVERESKFTPPEGARLLNLTVRKPDGRVLEPGAPEGSDWLLPDLEVGDTVDAEYLETGTVGEGIGALKADAADNRRIFLFNSLTTRTRRSEQYLVGPGLARCEVVTGGGIADLGDAAPGRHYRTDDPQRWPMERNRPPDRTFLPWAGVNCGNQTGDALRFWGGILAWRTRSSTELRAFAARLARGAKSNDEKLARLFAALRGEVRGEWNGRFEDPTFILNNRQGNRLLVARAVLQLWGLPHEYWVVADPEDYEASASMPNPGLYGGTQLIRVEWRGERRFVSLGSEFGAPDLTPPGLSEAPAVVIDSKGAARFDKLPPFTPAETRVVERREFSPDGSAAVSGSLTFSPFAAARVRGQLAAVPEDKRAPVFEKYVQGIIPGIEGAQVTMAGLEDPLSTLALTYRGRLRGANPTSDGLLLPQPAPESGVGELADRESRRLPLWLSANADEESIQVTMVPPPGWRIEPVDPLRLSLEGLDYRLDYTGLADGAVRYDRLTRVKRLRLPAEKYADWAQSLRKTRLAEQHRPVMVKSP